MNEETQAQGCEEAGAQQECPSNQTLNGSLASETFTLSIEERNTEASCSRPSGRCMAKSQYPEKDGNRATWATVRNKGQKTTQS